MRKKRGRRGGIRNRLWRRFNRPPLPSIRHTNLRSLSNKVDAIQTYTRYCNEFREASLLCFTESWFQSTMPNSLFEVPGFTLLRADRDADSGETRGGGICVYINELWCRQQVCDPNVEILGMTLRPFYLLRKFGCILLFVVYTPPNGKASLAASTIADCVHELQLSCPDAPAIVLGDLNQCHLETVLPGFEQYVKDQTRKGNILNKCFVNVKGVYVSKCRPPILNLDHNVVHDPSA